MSSTVVDLYLDWICFKAYRLQSSIPLGQLCLLLSFRSDESNAALQRRAQSRMRGLMLWSQLESQYS